MAVRLMTEAEIGALHPKLTELLEKNKRESSAFVAGQEIRSAFLRRFGTIMGVPKCSDERIEISRFAGEQQDGTPILPKGVFRPYRSAGNKADLGYSYFNYVVRNDVAHAIGNGQVFLLNSVYHYASGAVERGCAGCENDASIARQNAMRLREQFQPIVENFPGQCGSCVMSVDTDLQSLGFHGEFGASLGFFNVARNRDMDPARFPAVFEQLYPSMHEKSRELLTEIALGNQREIAKRIGVSELRPLQHNTSTLAIGRRLDWIGRGKALRVGPYWLGWTTDVAKLAGVVRRSWLESRSNGEGEKRPMLVICAPYAGSLGEVESIFAMIKVRGLFEESLSVIRKTATDLAEELLIIGGIISEETWRFSPVHLEYQ